MSRQRRDYPTLFAGFDKTEKGSRTPGRVKGQGSRRAKACGYQYNVGESK